MKRALAIVAGFLALHAAATVRFRWQDGAWYADLLRVNPDVVLILAVAVAATLAAGYRAWLAHVAVLAFVFAVVYRLGETAVPAYRHRPFDPFNDVLELEGLHHLMTHGRGAFAQWAIRIGAGLGVVVAWLGLFAAMRPVLRAAAKPGFGFALLAVLQTIVVVAWLDGATPGRERGRVYTTSMFAAAASEADDLLSTGRWKVRERFAAFAAAARERLVDVPTDLGRLDGVDVVVLFVESYGRHVYRSPEGRRAVDAWLPAIEQELTGAGLGVASAFTTMSVSGGESSLAHAEFLTGTTVDTYRIFDRLLRSGLPTMPALLRARGHRTISVHPIMAHAWPEGMAYYGFDAAMFNDAFPYRGRNYHWGVMPDQFALAVLLDREFRPADRAPCFVHYVSVTSHAPWSHLPPYLPTWRDASAPDAFAGEPANVHPVSLSDFRDYPAIDDAYHDAIRYSLRTAAGFCRELTRPFLVFVLGDHQPPLALPPDATRDVPIHAITNRPDLLAPFRARGWSPGMRPADDAPTFPAPTFLADFLRDFSNGRG